jgi:hypothetical protein
MPRFSRILPEVVFLAASLMGGPVVGQERPVVLKATTIVDGRGQVIQNAIIVVEGGKIGRIGGAMPPGAITYDLTGLTVTPGWIDTHDHILWHFHNGRMSSVFRLPFNCFIFSMILVAGVDLNHRPLGYESKSVP